MALVYLLVIFCLPVPVMLKVFALYFTGFMISLFCRTFFHLSLLFILQSVGIGLLLGLHI